MASKFPEVVVLFIFMIAFVTTVLILAALLYIFIFQKYKNKTSYRILIHIFILKLIGVWQLVIYLGYIFTVFNDSALSKKMCKFNQVFMPFYEISESFQYFILWMVLLKERNLVGFDWLNSDNSNNREAIDNSRNQSILRWIYQKLKYHRRDIYLIIIYDVIFFILWIYSAKTETRFDKYCLLPKLPPSKQYGERTFNPIDHFSFYFFILPVAFFIYNDFIL